MAKVGAKYRWDEKKKQYVEVKGSYEAAKKSSNTSQQKTGIVRENVAVDPEWERFINSEIAKHVMAEQSKVPTQLTTYQSKINSDLYKPGASANLTQTNFGLGKIGRDTTMRQKLFKDSAAALGMSDEKINEMLASYGQDADVANQLHTLTAARTGDTSVLQGKKGQEKRDLKGLVNLSGYDKSTADLAQQHGTQDFEELYELSKTFNLQDALLTVEDYYRGLYTPVMVDGLSAAKVDRADYAKAASDIERFTGIDVRGLKPEEVEQKLTEIGDMSDTVDWMQNYMRWENERRNAEAALGNWQEDFNKNWGGLRDAPDYDELSRVEKKKSFWNRNPYADVDYLHPSEVYPAQVFPETASGVFDYMTEEQLRDFTYLYNQPDDGEAQARAYLEDLAPDLLRQRAEQQVKDAEAFAVKNGLTGTAAFVAARGANLVNSIVGATDMLAAPFRAAAGLVDPSVLENDPNNIQYDYLRYAQALDRANIQNIAEATEGLNIAGINIPSQIYSGIASGADSLSAGLVYGPVASAALGASAYSSARFEGEDMLDAGMQALFEGLTEKYSLDSMFSDTGSVVKSIAKNMLVEPTEELANMALNIGWDRLRYGENGEIGTRFNELRAKGYDEHDASIQIASEYGREALATVISSAFAGAFGGAVGGTMAAVEDNAAGSNLQSNNAEKSMLDLAVTLPLPEDIMKVAQEQLGAVTNGAKTSAAKIGRVFREMIKAVDEQTQSVVQATMTRNVNSMLKANGVNDAGMAESVTRIVAGNGTATTEDYQRVGANDKALSLTEGLISTYEGGKQLNEKAARIAEQAAKKRAKDATADEAIEPVGEADELAADEEITAEAAQQMVQESAAEYGENADIVAAAYEEGQDPVAFSGQFRKAYEYGDEGRNFEVISKSDSFSGLNPQQIEKAYTMGRGARVFKAEQSAKNRKGLVPVGNIDTSEIRGMKLNEAQRSSTRAISKLAQSAGFNVRFIASTANEEGKFTGKNGSWDKATRTITIDVNAGRVSTSDANYAMMQTAGHELTHFIKDFADTELFSQYQDFVFGHLSEVMDEAALDSKVSEYIERWAKAGKTIDRDGAIEEIVADASGDALLKMTDADIQQLSEQNPSLLKKIGDFIKRWVADVKILIQKAYKGQTARNAIAEQMVEAADELGKRWNELLKNAAQNARADEVEQAETPVKTETKAKENQPEKAGKFLAYGHIDRRTPDTIRSVDTQLFSSEVEEAQIGFAAAAQMLLYDVDASVSGQKFFSEDSVTGQKRMTSDFLGSMKDSTGWTWDKIRSSLEQFAAMQTGDTLPKNTVTNREMELYLDEVLSGGYTTIDGQKVAPWDEYIEAKKQYAGAAGEAIPQSAYDGAIDFVDYAFADADEKFSVRVTDSDTLDFLDNQETVTTYKTMQVVDGKLYPPMAAVVAGKYEDASKLGAWEQATERPDLIKLDSKGKPQFNLNKGKGKGSLNAAYNPYMHSSNLVLNDQFSGAYDRPNLVTVECEVPVSELTSGYHAQYAKDSVGWHAWHTGTVAGALRRKTGIERQVLLSRWIKPVRIVPEAEVAQMYKELLDGTGIAVPDNVVPPALLTELKKAGVEIAVSGRVPDNAEKYSVRDNYSADGMNWAVEEGLLTKADQRVLHKTLADKDYLKYNVAKTKDGKYVIPCETAIVFASGTYKTPVVEDVVIFNVNPRDYDRAIENAMEVLYGDERSYLGRISKYEAHEALEALLQDGSATVFPGPVRSPGESDGHEGRGKGRTGRAAAQRGGERAGEESVDYQLRDPDQISDRALLANVMESAATNEAELDFVRRYRKQIDQLNEKQAQLDETNQAIVAARKNGARKSDIAVLQNKADILAKQINRMDGQLLKFEAGKPLQAVVKREREVLRRKANERTKARVAAVRQQEAEKRERLNQTLAEVREKRDQKLAALRQEKKDAVKKVREEKDESFGKDKYRKRLAEDVGTLRTWVTSPTNKEHVPQFLRAPLGDLINALDFSSARSLKGGEATQKDAKLTAALDAMNTALRKLREQQMGLDSGASAFASIIDLPFGYHEAFADMVDEIKSTLSATQTAGDGPINRMTAAQLRTLSDSICTLTTSIRQMNRLLANAKYESAVNAANATITDLGKMAPKKDTYKAINAIGKFMDWTNTVPYYAFKRFGKGGQAIFEGLMDGWDKLAFNSDELVKFANDTYTTKEVRQWSREVRQVELSGGDTVRMTTAQLMSLYCLSKRAQAMGHLMGGGIRIADIESKGKNIVQSENYTLSERDLDTFTGMLTERQRAVADKLQQFMSTKGAEWGNEVSMKRFGYEMFTEQFYFPIETDSNNRIAIDEQAEENSLFRLLNMSATKGLVKGANNALVVRDIFDVFTAHSSDMAKYNALGLQILDALKWLNYVEKVQNDDGTLTTSSVQKSLERAYGTDARKYILNLLRDLNGVREGGRNDGMVNKVISNAKIASVAGNVRVWLLQVTSMPRAAYAINPKYLSIGLAKMAASPKRAIRLSEDKVGIAKWKSMGFYDTNISGNIREMVKHDQNVAAQVRDKSMAPAGVMDALTMGVIYYAAEAEVGEKYRNTPRGGDVWNKLVNDRVREIVYQTQVVDSTMTRSDAMRGKGIITLATSFMSEPTLTMNMLADSIYDMRMNKRAGESIKVPTAKFAKALSVFTFTAVVTAAVEALFDAERDDDEYEDFGEKWMSAFIGDMTQGDTAWQKATKVLFSNVGSNLNVLNNIPFASDAMSMLQGYDNSPMYSAFIDSFKSGYDAYQRWLAGKGTWYSWVYSGLKGLSQFSGLPISNLTREATSVWNTFVADWANKPRIQTYSNNKGDAAKAYYAAIGSGDSDRAAYILERARINGIPEEDIGGSLVSYIKDDYISGDITEAVARKRLDQHTDKGADKIDEYIKEWTYQRETGFKYDDMKADYISGAISRSEMQTLLVQYRGYDSDEVFWKLSEWDYEKNTGAEGGKYSWFLDAVDAGSGYEKHAQDLLNHGTDKSDIARAISGAYKDAYLAIKGTPEGDAMLEYLLDVYESIGYDRDYERRYISKNWK